jgi:hypothetical protein
VITVQDRGRRAETITKHRRAARREISARTSSRNIARSSEIGDIRACAVTVASHARIAIERVRAHTQRHEQRSRHRAGLRSSPMDQTLAIEFEHDCVRLYMY